MDFIIREGTIEDAEEKGYVHFTSWKETYTGLMPQEYLDILSLDRSIKIARDYPQNTLVAIVEGRVVGFAGYLEDSRDIASIKPSSEIMAIYLLKAYQHQGIGYALMEESLKRLSKKQIVLSVLKDNDQAIRFYEKFGFIFSGHEYRKPVIGGELHKLEMALNR